MEKENVIVLKDYIEQLAKQLLKDIGIKSHLLGFEYWLKAIYMTIDIELNNRQKLKMMELYYMLAREYKTTVSNVRKAMQYTFQNIDINKYFNVTYKINNTALLFLFKDKILEQIKTIS